MAAIWAFVRLSRPHFLLGGALMFAIGVRSAGGTDAGTYLLGQALVTSAQLTAHYVNEYADRHADEMVLHRTLFSGGSGVLTEGHLSPRAALTAGAVTSTMALGLAAAVALVSPAAATIGIVTLIVSWTYSMPPVRLLGTGWGELATSLVVAAAVPMVGALVAAGSIPPELLWVMASLVPVHVAMMLAFELPDLDTDRAAGKRVMAVRLGSDRARRLMMGLLAVPVGVVAAGTIGGILEGAAWWTIVGAAVPAAVLVHASGRARYGTSTASAVAVLVVLAGGLLLVV